VKAYRDRWETPHDKNPFAIPMAEKLELLRRVSEEAKKGAKVFSSNATLSLRGEDKYFASTEGSSIQQLILQIYGNVHPTEVDRALGYEANYAGTSYITMDKIGKRIASEHCTFVGDRISARALATVGYDDDGVKATQWTIIDKGIFKSYQTTREQAHF